MGFLNFLFKKLSNTLAAKEISPHSWDNAVIEKAELTDADLENFMPNLKIYLGEDNFEEVYKKFKKPALYFEREINFIRDTGEPLNRELSLLLSFDIAKVMEKQNKKNIHELRSIVVYPTYLPAEYEAAGVMFAKGPRGHIESLLKLKNAVLLTDMISDKHSTFNPYVKELESFFRQIKKGISTEALSEFKIHIKGIATYTKKNYTKENIKKSYEVSSADIQSVINNSLEPEDLHQVVNEIQKQWDSMIASDQYSIHFSWPHLLTYMAEKGKNLFTHEMAHFIDYQNFYTFSFDFDNKWESLKDRYQTTRPDDFVLGDYAFTNSKEFFAVATEYYFRHPKTLKNDYPKLFKLLKDTYGKVPFDHQPVSAGNILRLMKNVDLYKETSEVA